jgi:hypothetical protein
LLEWDEESGLFHWTCDRGSAKSGQIAGYVNHYGHRQIVIDRQAYPASHLVYLLKHSRFPKDVVHHRNSVKDEDLPENLLPTSFSQHTFAGRKRRKGRVLGVQWDSQKNGWLARIRFRHVELHLGFYDDKADATRVREEAELALFGQYSALWQDRKCGDLEPQGCKTVKEARAIIKYIRDGATNRRSQRGRKGEQHGRSLLTEPDVIRIRQVIANGANPAEVAKEYGVTRYCISDIVNRRSWKHLLVKAA